MPIKKKKTTLRPKQNKGKKVASRAKPMAKKATTKKAVVKKPSTKKKGGVQMPATVKKAKVVNSKKVGSANKVKTKPGKTNASTAVNKKASVKTKKSTIKSTMPLKKSATANVKMNGVKKISGDKPGNIKKNEVDSKKSDILAKKTENNPVKGGISVSGPAIKQADPFIPKRSRTASGGPTGFAPYKEVRGEDYMNDAQLAHFSHVLNLWKQQLYIDRDATTQHMRDDSVNFPDPLDRAALEEEHTLEWRAREREHRLIVKIEQALSRIKQGDYGYCEVCGAEIGIRRLEARPTATLCIDCKTIDEIRERQTGTVE